MSIRTSMRRLREAIGSSTVHVPCGIVHLTFDLKESPRQESMLARIAREGGKWWERNPEAGESRKVDE